MSINVQKKVLYCCYDRKLESERRGENTGSPTLELETKKEELQLRTNEEALQLARDTMEGPYKEMFIVLRFRVKPTIMHRCLLIVESGLRVFWPALCWLRGLYRGPNKKLWRGPNKRLWLLGY